MDITIGRLLSYSRSPMLKMPTLLLFGARLAIYIGDTAFARWRVELDREDKYFAFVFGNKLLGFDWNEI